MEETCTWKEPDASALGGHLLASDACPREEIEAPGIPHACDVHSVSAANRGAAPSKVRRGASSIAAEAGISKVDLCASPSRGESLQISADGSRLPSGDCRSLDEMGEQQPDIRRGCHLQPQKLGFEPVLGGVSEEALSAEDRQDSLLQVSTWRCQPRCGQLRDLTAVQQRGRWRTMTSMRRYQKGSRLSQQFGSLPKAVQAAALRAAEEMPRRLQNLR